MGSDSDVQRLVPSSAIAAEFAHVTSLVERYTHTPDSSKLVFVMVGLPARGKSFISMRLAQFLQWTGIETQVFNVGKHRRNTETGKQDASYFDPTSAVAKARREELAMEVIQDMLSWVDGGSERFAIFDATNTTKARRLAVARQMRGREDLGVIFVESVCDDQDILEANIALKLRLSPDYASMATKTARDDLLQRVAHYEKVYEPVDEEAMELEDGQVRISYIKLLNLSSHVVAHNIWGRVATTVLPFLMALHIGTRPVWLVRLPHSADTAQAWRAAGQWPAPTHVRFSEHGLSPTGAAFADALAAFAKRKRPEAVAFSCTFQRGLEVAERLGRRRVRASLNPQDRGASNGLTPKEIAAQNPEVWADPLRRRFPGGESLADVVQRLLPTLIEIEQEMRPAIIVAPLSVLQVLYCHYAARPISEALTVELPLHAVVELRPDGGNFKERRFLQDDLKPREA